MSVACVARSLDLLDTNFGRKTRRGWGTGEGVSTWRYAAFKAHYLEAGCAGKWGCRIPFPDVLYIRSFIS